MIKQSIMRSSSRTLTTKWKKPGSSNEKSYINGLINFSVESLDFLKKDFPWLAKFRQWQKERVAVSISLLPLRKRCVEFWNVCLNSCSRKWPKLINNFESSMSMNIALIRNSHLKCSIEKDVPENLAIFTGKHLCRSLFLLKLLVRRHVTLLKRYTNTGAFLWKLRNF